MYAARTEQYGSSSLSTTENKYLSIQVCDETSALESVVVGLANDLGPIYPITPKIKMHQQQGTLPLEQDLKREIDALARLLEEQGITVYRPRNIPLQDQMYPRDIACVIDDVWVRARMAKKSRVQEYEGIQYLVNQINPSKICIPPDGALLEFGDCVQYKDTIFLGQSDRTNHEGYRFLQQSFPHKEVIPLDLVVSDDPQTNVLHLDCIFQPVGVDRAVMCEQGFLSRPEAVYDIFGAKNIFNISAEEKNHLFPNVLSLAPDQVVSEKSFVRLNTQLRKWEIMTLEVSYTESSKLDGLIRCSTLPLRRRVL